MNYAQALERETTEAMWQDMILAHELATKPNPTLMAQTWESIQDKSSIDFICGAWLGYPRGSWEESHAKEFEATTQWRLIIKGDDCRESFYVNKYMHTDTEMNQPKTNISFFDAAAICNAMALSQGHMPRYWFETSEEGFVPLVPDTLNTEKVIEVHEDMDSVAVRLPTAEEWIHACRCGADTDTPWGDFPKGEGCGSKETFLDPYAWFWENSKGQIQPVGQKLPTPWGVYDMLGNAFEWTTTLWTEGKND